MVRAHIVVARRQGNTWYLGGMTDWTARDIRVPLTFLGEGNYAAKLYTDGSLNENQPNAINVNRRVVTAADTLPIAMA